MKYDRDDKTKLLRYWLENNGMTQTELAAICGTSKTVLNHWAAETKAPGPRFAARIEVATRGGVPTSYWTGLRERIWEERCAAAMRKLLNAAKTESDGIKGV